MKIKVEYYIPSSENKDSVTASIGCEELGVLKKDTAAFAEWLLTIERAIQGGHWRDIVISIPGMEKGGEE